jgi:hypothetical protein
MAPNFRTVVLDVVFDFIGWLVAGGSFGASPGDTPAIGFSLRQIFVLSYPSSFRTSNYGKTVNKTLHRHSRHITSA